MKYSICINGQERFLELTRNGGVSCTLDGERFEADVIEVKPGMYSLLINGKSFSVSVAPAVEGGAAPSRNGDAQEYTVEAGGERYSVVVRDPKRSARARRAKPTLEGKQNIVSLMPGKIVRLLVSEGQDVQSRQGVIVVEAMKMQNEIKCPMPGKVQKILVRTGQAVNTGEVLLIVE
ncbi:MAG: acetyl-CoA carboxylase biotin carboxyl carrier protein subunit [Acidobacteria bacterium]|nr:acetyl-CoA carboxylase biotin carboxyl carrier protein subunit [Acidobacteriota bacterium]